MKTKPRTERRSGCPISISLDVLGDRWSLLIVRDLMFKGMQTFNEFASSDERIATNILTDRLGKLEAAGILASRADPTDARRVRYRLTAKGIDLAPVLVELVLWASRYEKTDAPPHLLRAMRRDREQFLLGVREQWAATA